MYSKHFLNVNIDNQKYNHYHCLFYHLLLMNKNFLLVVILDNEMFYKNQSIHMDMHVFFLNISNLLGGHSDIKYLKSLSCKSPAKESSESL